jgi:molybdopterin-guanine dinucleotide biosynthesis protein A
MVAGAIILAGGKSTRMGTNKALLKIQDTPNVERIVNVLRPNFPHQVLVTNDPNPYHFLGVKTVKDYFPGKGPLAGIHAGLAASPYEVNVSAACDMPFVSAELAKALVEKSHHYDAVIPVIGGMQQPLFAVYKKTLIDVIEEKIKSDQLRMKDLLRVVNVLYVTEQELKVEDNFERIFFNMNHPHEYEEALQLASDKHSGKGELASCNFSKLKQSKKHFN